MLPPILLACSEAPTVGPPGAILAFRGTSRGRSQSTPKNSRIIYAGTLGEGIFKSVDGGLTWAAINNGLTVLVVRSLVIDPRNSSIVYASTRGGDVFKTLDGGETWISIKNGLRIAGVESLALDSKDPDIIYTGTTGDGVFVSFDAGGSWSRK